MQYAIEKQVFYSIPIMVGNSHWKYRVKKNKQRLAVIAINITLEYSW